MIEWIFYGIISAFTLVLSQSIFLALVILAALVISHWSMEDLVNRGII